KVLRFVLGMSIATASGAAPVSAQGWGVRHLEVSLTRKMPSVISLTGKTKVRLEAKTQGQVPPQLAEVFRSRLQAEMFKDSRILEEKTSPDIIVEATITAFSINTKPVQRSTYDLATKKNVFFVDKVADGDVAVSYRALDAKGGNGLDASNLQFGIEQE